MANRKRKFVLRVPVTPEERALIQQKMAQLTKELFGLRPENADRRLYRPYRHRPVRADRRAAKIGVNNQIARRINSTGTCVAQDF